MKAHGVGWIHMENDRKINSYLSPTDSVVYLGNADQFEKDNINPRYTTGI